MVVDTPAEKYDTEEIYCRKLGHHLTFKYCRQEQQPLPCSAVKNCWQSRIPVEEFLKDSFPQKEIEYLENPPKPKIFSILDILNKVK